MKLVMEIADCMALGSVACRCAFAVRSSLTAAEIGCGVGMRIYCAVMFAMPRGSLGMMHISATAVRVEIPI